MIDLALYSAEPLSDIAAYVNDTVTPVTPSFGETFNQSAASLGLMVLQQGASTRPIIMIDTTFQASSGPHTPSSSALHTPSPFEVTPQSSAAPSPFEPASRSAGTPLSAMAGIFRDSAHFGSQSPCTTIAQSSPTLLMDACFPKFDPHSGYTEPIDAEGPESQTLSQTIESQFQNAIL